MEHMIGLTDTVYLGYVDEVELGASALAGICHLVIYMLGFSSSVGAQVLMARRNDEGEYEWISGVFTQGRLFPFLLAAVLFTTSNLLTPYLLRRMIGLEEVCRATMSYLDWRMYGFFFSFIAAMFRASYVSMTDTKILAANSAVMVLTNMVLNYILIPGKFGFPVLRIAGAAIASSISEAVSVMFFMIYTWKKVDCKKYSLFHSMRVGLRIPEQVLSVSIWVMIQYGIAFGGQFIFFIAIEYLGERPLAITDMVRNISSLLFVFVNAFASTNSSLVSSLIGAGESDRVLLLCRRMIGPCYALALPIGISIIMFPSTALHIYADNPDLIVSSTPSLWVMLSSYLFAVPGSIYFSSVSGTGNTRRVLKIDMASVFVHVLYILYVVIWLYADVTVCWTTGYIYSIMIPSSFFYLWKGNWRDKKI